ncbi:hypothetical protein GW17_00030443 [Ensete ventricosum]|nr:hypothetical protein GW17_00030443 [Ensete ventricosum]
MHSGRGKEVTVDAGGATSDQGGTGRGDDLVQQQRPLVREVVKDGAKLAEGAWIEGQWSLDIYIDTDEDTKGGRRGWDLPDGSVVRWPLSLS